MDFTIGPPPDLQAVTFEFLENTKLVSFKTLTNTVTDFALVGIAGRFIASGRFAARVFELQPGLSKKALVVVPFTLAAREPGVLAVILDVAFYKGLHPAFTVLDDAYRRYVDWLRTVSRDELLNSLGQDGYDLLTEGGTRTSLRAELLMPPAWLADP